jgi:hypothetical protein
MKKDIIFNYFNKKKDFKLCNTEFKDKSLDLIYCEYRYKLNKYEIQLLIHFEPKIVIEVMVQDDSDYNYFIKQVYADTEFHNFEIKRMKDIEKVEKCINRYKKVIQELINVEKRIKKILGE